MIYCLILYIDDCYHILYIDDYCLILYIDDCYLFYSHSSGFETFENYGLIEKHGDKNV